MFCMKDVWYYNKAVGVNTLGEKVKKNITTYVSLMEQPTQPLICFDFEIRFMTYV